jgi:hypothetical protein
MQNLNTTELTTIVGGTTQNAQITQQLTQLQTSLQTATTANNPNNNSNNTMMMMAMMMAMRPQPTVVAAGGPGFAAAPGPVVNVNTRVRRW